MKWPFGRRRPPSDAQLSSLPSPIEITMNTGPLAVYETEYEPLINSLLERALEQSQSVPVGEEFSVSLTDEERDDCADFHKVGIQVLLRSTKLKEFEELEPLEAFNGTITFYKVPPPPRRV